MGLARDAYLGLTVQDVDHRVEGRGVLAEALALVE